MNSTTTLAIRLPEKLSKRLESLAKKTGRTKTYYATKAIERHLEEIEDIYISLERLEKPGKRYSIEEVEKLLELED